MLILLVLFSLSAVCAADVDNSTVNNYDYGTLSADYQDSVISDDEKPDIPDLIVDDKKHVYQSNINLYFKNGAPDWIQTNDRHSFVDYRSIL